MKVEEDLIDKNLIQRIPHDLAWQYRVVPAKLDDASFDFFADETSDLHLIRSELRVVLGKNIVLRPTTSAVLTKLLNEHYLKEQAAPTVIQVSLNSDFIDKIVIDAYSLKSSDIHIERYEDACRIRFRMDGHLVERYHISPNDFPALINKIKIRANLDIAEKRLPQDGRIHFINSDIKFDLRVSTLPTNYGEKIVLRILGSDSKHLTLDTLGFSDLDLQRYKSCIRRSNGIVLISGPTGSGKSTTLHATLQTLNDGKRNIITIEDPIEYTIKGVNQVLVRSDIGLDFATALRTVLRQDPDIIMVGEIRDSETATMAIRAALTGHLVFSTIHTNSAWGTISRLTDMGIPRYLLANTLVVSLAQRLLRKLCDKCKRHTPFDDQSYPPGFSPYTAVNSHYLAVGCEQCFYTGYRGRVAIYELLPINDVLADCIRKSNDSIADWVEPLKIHTLSRSAFDLFKNGITSIDEIYSIIHHSE